MKKILFGLLSIVAISTFAAEGCNSSSPMSESLVTGKMAASGCHAKPSTNPTMLVGGWYPVFFSSYDQKQVDQIVKQIKEGKVESVKISYDQSAKLAKKIQARIEKKTKFKTKLTQVVNQDSATTQYNHTQVVVTVTLGKPTATTRAESK